MELIECLMGHHAVEALFIVLHAIVVLKHFAAVNDCVWYLFTVRMMCWRRC